MDPTINNSLFTFGVIADVQYADADDGSNYQRTCTRHYRNSLNILKQAVKTWKNNPNISFIAQMGDLIDGINSKFKQSKEALDVVLNELRDFKVYHIIGNHELYNFDRDTLQELLNTSSPTNKMVAYYDFVPHPGWRIVILDGFQFSTIETSTREEALKYLAKHNPNDCSNFKHDWSCGLVGLDKRFLPYSGAVADNQLEWLRETLNKATKNNEKVIVLTHIPFCPEATSPSTLLWNYDKVLDVLHSTNCVVACLAGHEHGGGYSRDEHGIHHKTFESPLETPVGYDCFGVIDVYDNKMVLTGYGVIESAVWEY